MIGEESDCFDLRNLKWKYMYEKRFVTFYMFKYSYSAFNEKKFKIQ